MMINIGAIDRYRELYNCKMLNAIYGKRWTWDNQFNEERFTTNYTRDYYTVTSIRDYEKKSVNNNLL